MIGGRVLESSLRGWFGCIAALGLTLGCASATAPTPGGRVAGGFPSAATIEQLKNGPPPDAIFASDLRDLGDWELVGPFPEMISAEPWTSGSIWDGLLSDVRNAAGTPVLATRSLHCVAREYARIALERSGRPDVSTQRFITGACNASVASVTYAQFAVEGVESLDEEQLYELMREQALPMLRAQAAAVARPVMGVAVARDGARAVLVQVLANRVVELEPVRTEVGPDGRIELRGRVLGPAAAILGLATHGRYQVRACDPIGSVVLPAFHLACDLDPDDEWASITVAVQRPNRMLAESALHVLAWQHPAAKRSYRRFVYSEPRAVSDTASIAPILLEELNGVRSRAGLAALTLDSAQTATATAVAPGFFAAAIGGADNEQTDLIALGVLAGWDVDGMIKKGEFAFGAVPETRDVSVLLSAVLEEPMSRSALLAPDSKKIALGPLLIESEGVPVLAMVFCTYEMLEPAGIDAEAEQLFDRLAATRAERGLAEPYQLIEVWSETRSAANDVGRGEHAQAALDQLATTSSQRLRSGVSTWYFETSDLDSIEFPADSLSSQRLGAAIGVAHRKGPDDAWGRYVVMGVNRPH